jgi:hypothetical protein
MSARAVGATSLTQQSENFGYSTVRLRRINKLQFGIVNPIDLVRELYLKLYIYIYIRIHVSQLIFLCFDLIEFIHCIVSLSHFRFFFCKIN